MQSGVATPYILSGGESTNICYGEGGENPPLYDFGRGSNLYMLSGESNRIYSRLISHYMLSGGGRGESSPLCSRGSTPYMIPWESSPSILPGDPPLYALVGNPPLNAPRAIHRIYASGGKYTSYMLSGCNPPLCARTPSFFTIIPKNFCNKSFSEIPNGNLILTVFLQFSMEFVIAIHFLLR